MISSFTQCLSKIQNPYQVRHEGLGWTHFINDENRHLATKEALDMINQLLVYDHKSRLTAKEAMNHPFFSLWIKHHNSYSLLRTNLALNSILATSSPKLVTAPTSSRARSVWTVLRLLWKCNLCGWIGSGYRHIDSASIYRNGRDIRVPKREEVFITSKIAPQEQGYQETIDACKKILTDLDTSYLDLLLIHWPGCAGLKPQDEKNA